MSMTFSRSRRRNSQVRTKLTLGWLQLALAMIATCVPQVAAASWASIATQGVEGASRPALLRSESGHLQIVWAQSTNGAPTTILRRGVASSGAISSTATTVVSGWQRVSAPAVTTGPDEKVVTWFGGEQINGGGSAFPAGALASAISTSSTATGWQSSGSPLSQSTEVLASGALSADSSGEDGPSWLAWAGASGVTVAAGSHTSLGGESTVSNTGGASEPRIAVDRATQTVWLSWCNGSTGLINVQQISPGGGVAEELGELKCNATMLARSNTGTTVHGGVFVAACVTIVPCQKIRMVSLPGGKAFDLRLPDGTTARNIALAPAPLGKIWIIWHAVDSDGSVSNIAYARTDSAVTRVGKLQTTALPTGGATPGWVGGDGNSDSDPGAPLDLVLVSSSDGNTAGSINHLRVIPALEVSGRTKGFRTRIVVTEAGDPVVNAYVKFRGRKGFTNKKGQIAFSFERGWSRKKKYKAVASKKGYVDASTIIAGSMKR